MEFSRDMDVRLDLTDSNQRTQAVAFLELLTESIRLKRSPYESLVMQMTGVHVRMASDGQVAFRADTSFAMVLT